MVSAAIYSNTSMCSGSRRADRSPSAPSTPAWQRLRTPSPDFRWKSADTDARDLNSSAFASQMMGPENWCQSSHESFMPKVHSGEHIQPYFPMVMVAVPVFPQQCIVMPQQLLQNPMLGQSFSSDASGSFDGKRDEESVEREDESDSESVRDEEGEDEDSSFHSSAHHDATPEGVVIDVEFPPSMGSIGHPHSCSQPCKYFLKSKRGCKDGDQCDHCHLCTTVQSRQRRSGDAPRSSRQRRGGRKHKKRSQAPSVSTGDLSH